MDTEHVMIPLAQIRGSAEVIDGRWSLPNYRSLSPLETMIRERVPTGETLTSPFRRERPGLSVPPGETVTVCLLTCASVHGPARSDWRDLLL